MRKILIATHSTFASGVAASLELLIGTAANISVIDAYVDDSDYTKKIDDFFSEYDSEDEYIVFTDLFGGSVNQKVFSYKHTYDFHLITGFNLPILLEIILSSDELTNEVLKDLVEKCRQELFLVDLEEMEEEKEEDFI